MSKRANRHPRGRTSHGPPIVGQDSVRTPEPWRLPGPPWLWFSAATMLCLLPWVNKPLAIDDPLFLLSAERIRQSPLDFYGGNVNWYGTSQPLADVMMNPPLQCYYLALVSSVVGIDEPGLHLAMMLPAILTVLGAYSIAARCCEHPMLAALALLVTPAFLVSSTSLMCDVPMLALWVWALALWMRGIDDDQQVLMFAAAILMGLCALTKYFGLCVLPLAVVYAAARRRSVGIWCFWPLVTLAILAGFEWYTRSRYGHGFLSGAAVYATKTSSEIGLPAFDLVVEGLVFAGGALLTLLFFAPWLWSRRGLAVWLIAAVVIGAALGYRGNIASLALAIEGRTDWNALIQSALFCLAGLMMVCLPIMDVARRRDVASLLLLLWIGGTFVFAACFNWTINVRSVLPAAPAAAIVVVRRLELGGPAPIDLRSALVRYAVPLTAGLCLSLLLCWADYRSAKVDWLAADQVADRYAPAGEGNTLWVEGHWGLQYYLEHRGGKCIDYLADSVQPGDAIVIPDDNTGLKIASTSWEVLEELHPPLLPRLTTFSNAARASFYSHFFGELPYRFGAVPPRAFRIYRANATYRFRDHPAVAGAAGS